MTGPAATAAIIAAMATGDFAGAKAMCLNASVAHWTPDIEHALALCEHQLGDVGAALRRLETLLERRPDKTAWHVDVAGMLAARERWAEVHARLSPLVDELDHRGMTLWLASAVATGSASEGLRAIAATPNRSWTSDIGCVVEFARMCFAGNDLVAAADAARWCLEQRPEAHRAREVLALVLQRGEDRERALPHWRELAEAQPDRGRRHLELSVALAQLGCHDEARAARLEALRRPLSGEELSAALYLGLFDERENGATILATYSAALCDVPRVAPR
jgi:tetratricopeptide (TPR) repeat protein